VEVFDPDERDERKAERKAEASMLMLTCVWVSLV
jgi:hypothetical protein